MTKQKPFSNEFEDDAVRLAWSSGQTCRELASDLGVGLSTRKRWIGRSRDRAIELLDTAATQDVASELTRLRRENAIPSPEWQILKAATAFFRQGGKSVRFALIDEAKESFPVHRLCHVPGVSQWGYFA